jgi:hypothetical protein
MYNFIFIIIIRKIKPQLRQYDDEIIIHVRRGGTQLLCRYVIRSLYQLWRSCVTNSAFGQLIFLLSFPTSNQQRSSTAIVSKFSAPPVKFSPVPFSQPGIWKQWTNDTESHFSFFFFINLPVSFHATTTNFEKNLYCSRIIKTLL